VPGLRFRKHLLLPRLYSAAHREPDRCGDGKEVFLIYMMISHDKYELPLAVADTIGELARILGKNQTPSAASCAMRGRRGTGTDTSRWTYHDL